MRVRFPPWHHSKFECRVRNTRPRLEMRRSKQLTLLQADALLRWDLDSLKLIYDGKATLVSLRWLEDQRVIEVIDRWIGLDCIELGSDGLLI